MSALLSRFDGARSFWSLLEAQIDGCVLEDRLSAP